MSAQDDAVLARLRFMAGLAPLSNVRVERSDVADLVARLDEAEDRIAALTIDRDKLWQALKAVVPYAESRAEDMSENVESINPADVANAEEAETLRDAAWEAVETAHKMLGDVPVDPAKEEA